MDRSDKRFDALLMRSDELLRRLLGVTARAAQSEAVAAQDLPGGRAQE